VERGTHSVKHTRARDDGQQSMTTFATAARSASACAVSWNIAGIIFGHFKFAGLFLADVFN
jgi:hypothetical protein